MFAEMPVFTFWQDFFPILHVAQHFLFLLIYIGCDEFYSVDNIGVFSFDSPPVVNVSAF